MQPMHHRSGFAVLGVLIAMGILAAMATGMAVLVATNQSTRTQQLYMDQAYYAAHGAFEYAMRQIQVDGNPDPIPTRHFAGEAFSITRTNSKVNVTTTKDSASNSFSITDPNPPAAGNCLNVDTTGKAITGNTKLTGLVLSRSVRCTAAIQIDSMTISWTPNGGQQANQIQIATNPKEYDGPAQSSGTNFDFGANDYVINDGNNHDLSHIRWDTNVTNTDFTLVFHMNDGSQKSVAVDFLADNQANCFTATTSAAKLAWNSSKWQRLQDLTYQNSCSLPIRLDTTQVSWTPTSPSRTLQQFRINNSNIYDSWDNTNSGITRDIDTTIPASTTYSSNNRFDFSDEMLNRDYTIIWTFVDATSKTTSIDQFASNQHNCLTFDTSNAARGGSDNKYLQNMTLENTCANDIGLTAVTVSWSGGVSGQQFKKLKVQDDTDDNNFSGNKNSGQKADFGDKDVYLRDGVGAVDITTFQFKKAVDVGITYTITFDLSDGNTKTGTVTLDAQASDLSIDTSSTTISGSGDIDLEGITITNNGASTITWEKFSVNWNGSSSRRVKNINVNRSQVWSGTAKKNKTKTLTAPVSLSPSQTKTINFFRFNGDMSGKTFDITFTMLDGSTKTTPSFTPPDG